MKNVTAYVSFNRAPSSPPSNQQNLYFTPGYGDEDTDDTDDLDTPRENNSSKWWKYFFGKSQERVESGYLTLIPLSDSRLKPQRTRSLLVTLFIMTFFSVLSVFFLVPRGVTVGTIQVHSSRMSFNTNRSTYVIVLTATLPIYNLNYLSVLVTGTVNISFYDQQAGFTSLSPTSIPPRTFPQVVPVDVDASSVPQKYLFTIYSQCFTFPDELIFFLRGNLQVTYLRYKYNLPVIDNYFIINCTANKPVGWEAEMNMLRSKWMNDSSPIAPHPLAVAAVPKEESEVKRGMGKIGTGRGNAGGAEKERESEIEIGRRGGVDEAKSVVMMTTTAAAA
mmetsp:Transcript_8406/g.16138  ORF Transcript_8406/g.16138 Transcript_8406/m.16138 type:complete len:334 (-) Transcript_8406:746-1747(-)